LTLTRKRITEFCEQHSPAHGEVDVDELYFSSKKLKTNEDKVHTENFSVLGIKATTDEFGGLMKE